MTTTPTKLPTELERLKKICDELEVVDLKRNALLKSRDEQFARVSRVGEKGLYSHSTIIEIMGISRSRHTQMISKLRRDASKAEKKGQAA